MSEWQKIETLPRDKTQECQLWRSGEYYTPKGYWEPHCRWNHRRERFELWSCIDECWMGIDDATHWLPQPLPPEH